MDADYGRNRDRDGAPIVNPHPSLLRERGRVREGAWYVCVRGKRVEQVWPITARGAVH
jgi:hypothetical protein